MKQEQYSPDQPERAIDAWIEHTDLNDSLLVGYYGGGNFGDELLLEILLNKFSEKKIRNLRVYYANPSLYSRFHLPFEGTELADASSKIALLIPLLKSKKIIIGGGGLWGLDFALPVFILSVALWVARFFLGKRIYIVGVGYYNSTTRLGRLGAWFAAKAANKIIVRDLESKNNFSKHHKNVELDKDIAWNLRTLNIERYAAVAMEAEAKIVISKPTIIIALRRFRHPNNYTELVRELIEKNPDKKFLVWLCEPSEIDPVNALFMQKLASSHPNVDAMELLFNPVAIFLLLKNKSAFLKVIAPQFHIMLVAHLAGVEFYPMAYDNKCRELLKIIGIKESIDINSLEAAGVNRFMQVDRV